MTISYSENNSPIIRTATITISGPCDLIQSIVITQNGSVATKIRTPEWGSDGSEIRLYPVPCTDYLFIDTFDGKDLTVQIFDAAGKPLKQFNSVSSVLQINLTDWKKGWYFYRILQKEKMITSGKFIKE